MDFNILYFFTDKIKIYKDFFQSVKDKAPFKVEIVTSKSFLGGKFSDVLKKARNYDFFIAVYAKHFLEIETDVKNYLKNLEINPFINFLYLYKDAGFFKEKSVINGHKNSFLLYKSDNDEARAISFVLYMINLFSKSISTFRLSDYIYHSFKTVVYSEILQKKKKEIERLNEELKRKNMIDDLTNLYNRSVIFKLLERQKELILDEKIDLTDNDIINSSLSSLTALGDHFSIMMIDIDHFKDVNDTYGHLVGDAVLKTLGALFQKEGILRDQDIAGRFGGEEFIIILPKTSVDNAYEPAQRLMHELSELNFSGANGEKFKITLSIGISEYHQSDKTGEDIIIRADNALYWAKEHGRNQIAIYERIHGKPKKRGKATR
ncbi:MAG: GGDEF domain-containing protein [Spirochaetales bacterium]|nr:GGDEF domain-containing protein [Spirochaetales bacterium]